MNNGEIHFHANQSFPRLCLTLRRLLLVKVIGPVMGVGVGVGGECVEEGGRKPKLLIIWWV